MLMRFMSATYVDCLLRSSVFHTDILYSLPAFLYVVSASAPMRFTDTIIQNHSCEPNCVVVAVYINEPHVFKPFLCMFTKEAIKNGEELTFRYGGGGSDDSVSLICLLETTYKAGINWVFC